MKYSIIVPLFNEEGNVETLHKKIVQIMDSLKEPYEIIFIDDCSSDKTREKCKHLSPLSLIILRKNSGQTAAIDAGIKEAKGEYIITLDGDLQNDPADIPKLIEHLEKNTLDVVSGWRKNRKDTFMKRFVSRGANFLRSYMIRDGIHDSGCSLKIYKRECFETLDLYGEMHRFIPALLKIRGYSIGECIVTHHPRTSGQTKYNWRRTIKGFLDMFSVWFWQKYISRPMHLLGGLGLTFFVLGSATSFVAIYRKIIFNQDLSDTTLTTLALFFFFFGITFILFGLLFDMVSKIYYSDSNDRSYLIRSIEKK